MRRMTLDEIKEELEYQISAHKARERALIQGCSRSDWHNGSWRNLQRALDLLNGVGEKGEIELYMRHREGLYQSDYYRFESHKKGGIPDGDPVC